LNAFLNFPYAVARIERPVHSSLFTFMNVIISRSLNNLYSSRLYLFPHVPVSSADPKCILRSSFQRYLTVLRPILTVIFVIFLRINWPHQLND
jgi:hypothetical protein